MKCAYFECDNSIGSQAKLSNVSNAGVRCTDCNKIEYCSDKCMRLDRFSDFEHK